MGQRDKHWRAGCKEAKGQTVGGWGYGRGFSPFTFLSISFSLLWTLSMKLNSIFFYSWNSNAGSHYMLFLRFTFC